MEDIESDPEWDLDEAEFEFEADDEHEETEELQETEVEYGVENMEVKWVSASCRSVERYYEKDDKVC